MNKLLTILTITLLLVGMLSTIYALEDEFGNTIEEVIQKVREVVTKKIDKARYDKIYNIASTDEIERYIDCNIPNEVIPYSCPELKEGEVCEGKDTVNEYCSVHLVGGELDRTFKITKGTKEEMDLAIEKEIDSLIIVEEAKSAEPIIEKKLQYSEVIKYEK